MGSHTNVTLTPKRGVMRVRTLDESLHGSTQLSVSQKSNVSFDKLYVREYGMVLGDNPSVSAGPPVSIGWEVQEEYNHDIENYEEERAPRRETFQMVIPRHGREALLKTAGHSRAEFASVIRGVNRTKNQRKSSVRNVSSTNFDEKIENVGRKFKSLFRKNKTIEFEHTWDPNGSNHSFASEISCLSYASEEVAASDVSSLNDECDVGEEERRLDQSPNSTPNTVDNSNENLPVKHLRRIVIEEK